MDIRRRSPHGGPSAAALVGGCEDRKSTRLNSSHSQISYAVFCLKKKNTHVNSSHSQRSYADFYLEKNQERLLIRDTGPRRLQPDQKSQRETRKKLPSTIS